MKQIFNHPVWRTHALLFARVLMGGFFLLAGIQKFQSIDGVSGYITSVGFPAGMALAWLVAIFEVAAGAALIVGKYFKEVAISLAVFVLFISFPFHGPSSWAEDPMQKMMFMKNMAIAAGLLFMAAHGAGNTWKIK